MNSMRQTHIKAYFMREVQKAGGSLKIPVGSDQTYRWKGRTEIGDSFANLL
jgi:hypothetical protein